MYSNTYPIVLGVTQFSTFNETLEHFNDIWIIFIYYIYYYDFYWEKGKGKVESRKKGVGGVGYPPKFV